MSVSELLKICAASYLVLIIVDWVRSRSIKRVLLEFVLLLFLVLLDILVASGTAGYVTFGPGYSPTVMVLIMFLAIVLGIAARYVFQLHGKFSWLDFAKPLCISPILLLPLIGSLETVESLKPMQMVSFGLLAFQNGFFWQVILQRATPKTQNAQGD